MELDQVLPAQEDRAPLRDRKRALLFSTIERSAIELSLAHGYDNLTVEMICEASMVSPRTFFNYFGSKERAVLGPPPAMPRSEELEKFVNTGCSNIVKDLATLLVDSLASQEPDRDLYLRRHTVIQRSPELAMKRMDEIRALEDEYVEVILARYLSQGREAVADTTELEDEARIVVAIVVGILGHVGRTWSKPGATSSIQSELERALQLFDRATNRESETSQ